MARIYATLVGIVLFLLGLVGVLLGDELLLGVVNIDVLEDLVHVVSGALLLYVGVQHSAGVAHSIVGAVSLVYLLVGLLGFVVPYLFGLLPHGYSNVETPYIWFWVSSGFWSTPTPGCRSPSGAPPTPMPDPTGIAYQ